jgi:hypothetical protein
MDGYAISDMRYVLPEVRRMRELFDADLAVLIKPEYSRFMFSGFITRSKSACFDFIFGGYLEYVRKINFSPF